MADANGGCKWRMQEADARGGCKRRMQQADATGGCNRRMQQADANIIMYPLSASAFPLMGGRGGEPPNKSSHLVIIPFRIKSRGFVDTVFHQDLGTIIKTAIIAP